MMLIRLHVLHDKGDQIRMSLIMRMCVLAKGTTECRRVFVVIIPPAYEVYRGYIVLAFSLRMLKSKRLIKKLEKMSFHAVIPLSLGSNLP